MQPISKPLYFASIFGSYGVAVALFVILAVSTPANGEPSPAVASLACAALPLFIFGTVMLMILIYKLWAAIQGGPARTTPGKAVGFSFIPFFNLYWIFQVYWGWAQDYNRYADELGLPLPRVSEGLGLAIGILMVASIVPIFGMLAGIAGLVAQIIFLNSACDAVNALLAAADDIVDQPPTTPGATGTASEWD